MWPLTPVSRRTISLAAGAWPTATPARKSHGNNGSSFMTTAPERSSGDGCVDEMPQDGVQHLDGRLERVHGLDEGGGVEAQHGARFLFVYQPAAPDHLIRGIVQATFLEC